MSLRPTELHGLDSLMVEGVRLRKSLGTRFKKLSVAVSSLTLRFTVSVFFGSLRSVFARHNVWG